MRASKVNVCLLLTRELDLLIARKFSVFVVRPAKVALAGQCEPRTGKRGCYSDICHAQHGSVYCDRSLYAVTDSKAFLIHSKVVFYCIQ